MRRRELLAGLATAPLAVSAAGSVPPADGDAAARRSLVQALHDVLLRTEAGASDSTGALDPTAALPRIEAELDVCMRAFQSSRYEVLATRLPALVRQTGLLPGDERGWALAAEVHNTVTRVFIKHEVPGLGWMSADRALTAARASGDPAVVASCTRSIVSLCRRDRHYADAQDLALRACSGLDVDGARPDPGHLSLYGMLLGNAAYAAAQAGDRARSGDLLDLADEAGRRLGAGRNEHWTSFGPTNVTLHRISVAFALGEPAAAIAHARTVDPRDLKLPERRSRYWVDVARAYDQWGKPDRCYRALVIAEQQAPQEVQARPVVHDLTHRLLASPASLPGVRDLARRVGVA